MSTWNTKKVTNMDKLFYDPPLADSNDHLSSFNGIIGDWDVSSVTSMSQMFKDADAFTGKNFYKWDTSKVRDMSGMFEHATMFNAKNRRLGRLFGEKNERHVSKRLFV